MHPLTNVSVLLILLLSAVLAAPTISTPQPGRFVVKRAQNPAYKPDGPSVMKAAYHKYSFGTPRAAHSNSQKYATGKGHGSKLDASNKATGTTAGARPDAGTAVGIGPPVGAVVVTSNQGDSEYLCPILVGGQQFNMNFDTGSADLWIFDSRNPSPGHGAFDRTRSPTFQELPGESFNISYVDHDTLAGSMGTDIVFIGGATVIRQPFGLATSFSDGLQSTVNQDGVLGMGFSLLSKAEPTPQKSFFENVMGHLDEPIFTADLHHGTDGTYEFGFIDDSKYNGSISYVPVDNSRGYWQVQVTKIKVGGLDLAKMITPQRTIVDTGASINLLDDSAVREYWAAVPGAVMGNGGYVFPCAAVLPELSITFDNYTAKIRGDLLSFQPVRGDPINCFGAVQSNAGQGMQILGGPFFKSQFVVFDGGRTRLGMAPH